MWQQPPWVTATALIDTSQSLMVNARKIVPEGAVSVEDDGVYRNRRSLCAQRVNSFIKLKTVTIVMAVVTFYALFGDDLRLALFPPGADDAFYALSSVAFVLFSAEMVLNIVGKDDYLWRFYFWLDLVATLSLIPDIGWVWSAIVGDDVETSSSALRAGRASRAGTRAGRIVRIVRLVRLIRLFKYMEERKKVKERGDAASVSEHGSVDEHDGHGDKDAAEPSHIGKKMSDLTTRRLIILVLLMLFVIPLFTISALEGDQNQTQAFGLTALQMLAFNVGCASAADATRAPCTDAAFNAQLQSYVVQLDEETPLMFLSLYGAEDAELQGAITSTPGTESTELRSLTDIAEDFRTSEREFAEITQCYNATGAQVSGECYSIAYFDTKYDSVVEAWLNIGKTLFVMVILILGALIFARDAESLVIQPIERMVSTVRKLADDPLAAVYKDMMSTHVDTYETQLLERTLQKVGSLLQVGFGAAGSQIIAQNLKSGDLNPMVPGTKMHGIFGFCDIRNFTDATECLQERVLMFVNVIGKIVHTATHRYGGAANKNIGDAFLLVWSLPEEDRDPRAVQQTLNKRRFGKSIVSPRATASDVVVEGEDAEGAEEPAEAAGDSGSEEEGGGCQRQFPRSWTNPTATHDGGERKRSSGEQPRNSRTSERLSGSSNASGDSTPARRVSDIGNSVRIPIASTSSQGKRSSTEKVAPRTLLPGQANGTAEESAEHDDHDEAHKSNSFPTLNARSDAVVSPLNGLGAIAEHESHDIDRKGAALGNDQDGIVHQHTSALPLMEMNHSHTWGEEEAPQRPSDVSITSPSSSPKLSRSSVARPDRAFLHLPKVAPTQRFSMFGGRTIYEEITQIHDNALFAFLKVIADLKRHNVSGELKEYCEDPSIKQRFGKGHEFRMGYGLHSGWAIEGAIGSKYKVDASYLSPNVNLASRLEAATKQFGVQLLMSEQFVSNLSLSAKQMTRCIDRITVKGSNQPFKLYTFDVTNYDVRLGGTRALKRRANASFAGNPGIRKLQQSLPEAFLPMFKKGVGAYLSGNWKEAKSLLESCLKLKENDGPSNTLLAYMGEFDFTAPEHGPNEWKGYRELTEK